MGRRLAGAVLATALVGATGCTGASDRSTGPVPGPSRVSPTAEPSRSRPPSVPVRARVTRVAGRLAARDRTRLAVQVGRTVAAYTDAAFLTGSYPRSAFGTSFGAFTDEAGVSARRSVALLTNQPLGDTTRSVRATRRTAYLSVLAPAGRVSGVTAAVDLVFRVDRVEAADRRVRLTGRLLLTQDRSGRWRIFGYDVARSGSSVRSLS